MTKEEQILKYGWKIVATKELPSFIIDWEKETGLTCYIEGNVEHSIYSGQGSTLEGMDIGEDSKKSYLFTTLDELKEYIKPNTYYALWL